MKKFINISIIFAILGLCLGVYYREATKPTSFYDIAGAKTQLSITHVHTLVLGMFFTLILGLILQQKNKSLTDIKLEYNIYLTGLILSIVMMVIRGSIQVFKNNLISKGLDSALSGLSGLGHIILAIGLISILFKLKKIYS